MTEASYARTIENLRTSSIHGRTTQEARNNAATQYETDIACLFDVGFEPTQAMLVMDLRDRDVSDKNALIGKFMTGGMSAVDAEGKAVKFYDRKDANRKDIILDNALMNEDEYRAFISEDGAINKTVNRKKTAWAATEEESVPAPRAEKNAKKSGNKKNGKSQQTTVRRKKSRKPGLTSEKPKSPKKPSSKQVESTDKRAPVQDSVPAVAEKTHTPEQDSSDGSPAAIAAVVVFTETRVTPIKSAPKKAPEHNKDIKHQVSEDTQAPIAPDENPMTPLEADDETTGKDISTPLPKHVTIPPVEQASTTDGNNVAEPGVTAHITPLVNQTSEATEQETLKPDSLTEESPHSQTPGAEDPIETEDDQTEVPSSEVSAVDMHTGDNTGSTNPEIQRMPDNIPLDAEDPDHGLSTDTVSPRAEEEKPIADTQHDSTDDDIITSSHDATNQTNQQGDISEADANDPGISNEIDAALDPSAAQLIQTSEHRGIKISDASSADPSEDSLPDEHSVIPMPTPETETPNDDRSAARAKTPEKTRIEPSTEGPADESPDPKNSLGQDEGALESAQEEDTVATTDKVLGNGLPDEIDSDSFVPVIPTDEENNLGELENIIDSENPDTDADALDDSIEHGDDSETHAEGTAIDDAPDVDGESFNQDIDGDTPAGMPPPPAAADRMPDQSTPRPDEVDQGLIERLKNRFSEDPDADELDYPIYEEADAHQEEPSAGSIEDDELPDEIDSDSFVPVIPTDEDLDGHDPVRLDEENSAVADDTYNTDAVGDLAVENNDREGELFSESSTEGSLNTHDDDQPEEPDALQEDFDNIPDESVTHTERPSQPTFVPERPDPKQPGLFSRTRSYLGRILSDDPNRTRASAAMDSNDLLDGIGSDSSAPVIPIDEHLGEEDNGENTNAIDTPDVMNDAADEYIPGDDPLPGQSFNADDAPFDQDNIDSTPPPPTADARMIDQSAPPPIGVLNHIDSHSSYGTDYPDSETSTAEGPESMNPLQPSFTPERPDKEDGVLARGLLWTSDKLDGPLNGDPDEQALRLGDEEPKQHQEESSADVAENELTGEIDPGSFVPIILDDEDSSDDTAKYPDEDDDFDTLSPVSPIASGPDVEEKAQDTNKRTAASEDNENLVSSAERAKILPVHDNVTDLSGLDLSDNPAGIVVDSINSADTADEAFTELSPKIDPSSNPAGIIVDPIDPLRAPYVSDNTDNQPTANSRPLSEIPPPRKEDWIKGQDPSPRILQELEGYEVPHSPREDQEYFDYSFTPSKPTQTGPEQLTDNTGSHRPEVHDNTTSQSEDKRQTGSGDDKHNHDPDDFSYASDPRDAGHSSGIVYSGHRLNDDYAPIEEEIPPPVLFPENPQDTDNEPVRSLFDKDTETVESIDPPYDQDQQARQIDPYHWRADKEGYDLPEEILDLKTPEEKTIQWASELTSNPFIGSNGHSGLKYDDEEPQVYNSIDAAKQEFLEEQRIYRSLSHTVRQDQQRGEKLDSFLDIVRMQLVEQGRSEDDIEQQLGDFNALVNQDVQKKPSLLSKALGRLGLNGTDKVGKTSPATPDGLNSLRPLDPSGYSERQDADQSESKNLFELPPSNASDSIPKKTNSNSGVNNDKEDDNSSPENIIDTPENTRDRDSDDWRTDKSGFDMQVADTTDNTNKQTRIARLMKRILR